jgi:hypothetical protein
MDRSIDPAAWDLRRATPVRPVAADGLMQQR